MFGFGILTMRFVSPYARLIIRSVSATPLMWSDCQLTVIYS